MYLSLSIFCFNLKTPPASIFISPLQHYILDHSYSKMDWSLSFADRSPELHPTCSACSLIYCQELLPSTKVGVKLKTARSDPQIKKIKEQK